MRGKNGTEIQIGTKFDLHLLGIHNADTRHQIHGCCCKKMTSAFGGATEQLFSDICCNFKNSTVFQLQLCGICSMLEVKYKMLEWFLSHRLLSTLDLTVDTLQLFDCYILLYYQFLPKSDKTTYHTILVDILIKKEIGVKARQETINLRNKLGKIQMPTEGKQRKGRIIKKLFCCTDDTLMQLKFFSSVLPLLERVSSALSVSTTWSPHSYFCMRNKFLLWSSFFSVSWRLTNWGQSLRWRPQRSTYCQLMLLAVPAICPLVFCLSRGIVHLEEETF